MNWYLKVLKQYVDFSGRARRKEYWMFVLFNLIFAVATTLLDSAFGLLSTTGYGPISGLYSLAVLLPGLAVLVRRLHDTGKSGWMFFVVLIPLVGAIWLLVMLCTDGEPGRNEWGENPKEEYGSSDSNEDVLDTF